MLLSFLKFEGILNTLQRVDDYIFNLFYQVGFPHVVAVLLGQPVLKVLQTPHVALYFMTNLSIFQVFNDRVV
jgi:hypothetical protein